MWYSPGLYTSHGKTMVSLVTTWYVLGLFKNLGILFGSTGTYSSAGSNSVSVSTRFSISFETFPFSLETFKSIIISLVQFRKLFQVLRVPNVLPKRKKMYDSSMIVIKKYIYILLFLIAKTLVQCSDCEKKGMSPTGLDT